MDILDFLAAPTVPEKEEYEKINIDLLDGSDTNFYKVEDIERLAITIELLGIQQNFVVTPKENGRYEIKAGHRRAEAVRSLVKRGKEEFRFVPCKVERSEDSAVQQLIEIYTNSTQRERDDREKRIEIEKTKELLMELTKTKRIPGGADEAVAQLLHMSKSKVGRLDNINRNLIPPFKAAYDRGEIATATANEIATFPEDEQIAFYKQFRLNGELRLLEVKEAKKSYQASQKAREEAQKSIQEELSEAVSEEMENEVVAAVEEAEQSGEEVGEVTVSVVTEDVKPQEAPKENVHQMIEQGNPTPQGTPEEQPKSGTGCYVVRIAVTEYEAYLSGSKPFILLRDEKYRAGDILELNAYDAGRNTGKMVRVRVTYKQADYTGLKEGWCILGLLLEREEEKNV